MKLIAAVFSILATFSTVPAFAQSLDAPSTLLACAEEDSYSTAFQLKTRALGADSVELTLVHEGSTVDSTVVSRSSWTQVDMFKDFAIAFDSGSSLSINVRTTPIQFLRVGTIVAQKQKYKVSCDIPDLP